MKASFGILIGIAVACVGIAIALPMLNLEYDAGQRTGTVIELKQTSSGNWEGVLSLGLLKKVPQEFKGKVISHKYVPDNWEFSVVSASMAAELLLAKDSQKPVKLTYKKYMNNFILGGKTDSYVTEVLAP